jgi:hypothetical protein
MSRKRLLKYPVCGSTRGGCFTLNTATLNDRDWCPLLERVLERRQRIVPGTVLARVDLEALAERWKDHRTMLDEKGRPGASRIPGDRPCGRTQTSTP